MTVYVPHDSYPTDYTEVSGVAAPSASGIGIGLEAIGDRFAWANARYGEIQTADANLTSRIVVLEGHHALESHRLVASGRYQIATPGMQKQWTTSTFGNQVLLFDVLNLQAGDIVDIVGTQMVSLYGPVGAGAGGYTAGELRLWTQENSAPGGEEPGARVRIYKDQYETESIWVRQVTLVAHHKMAAAGYLAVYIDGTAGGPSTSPYFELDAPLSYRWDVWRPNV